MQDTSNRVSFLYPKDTMATLTGESVENICEIISDLRGEQSTDTSAKRIRAITRAEQTFAKRKRWIVHLLRLQTTTGDGGADYTIGSTNYPMRLKGLAEVFVGGTTEDKRYQVVDYFKYQNLINNDNSVRIAYEYYDAANDLWKVRINPTVETGTTIYYSYFFQPPKRTATSDVVICPDAMYVSRQALGEIYEGEDEDDKSTDQFRQAEQIMGELLGLENSPAHNQLYAIGAIENSTTSKGVGTY